MNDAVPSGTDVDALPNYPSAEIKDWNGSGIDVSISLVEPQRIETGDQTQTGTIKDHTGENAHFRLSFASPATVLQSEQVLADLQAFVAFAFQSTAAFSFERSKTDPDTKWLDVLTHHQTDKGSRRTHQWPRMLLLADDFDLSVVLPNWFRLLDDVFPVLQILAIRINSQSRVVESSTSSVLAAAERLHEYVGSTQERFDPQSLKANQVLILAAVKGPENKPFRAFLREVTRVVHPTLQTKLEELFDSMEPAAAGELGIDRDAWVSEAKNVRNLLAHTGSHVARRAGDGRLLLDRVEDQTRAIISVVILGILGVPAAAIVRAATVLKTEITVWANN